MKKWLYIVSIMLVITTASPVWSIDRIAVVNITNIFQQSPQRATVAKELEEEFKDRVTELQCMERDLQSKTQKLQNTGNDMNPQERKELEQSLMIQREKFSSKIQSFEQDNHRRQTEERHKILSQIHEIVRNIAHQEEYDIVIDISALAYFNPSKDITNSVLAQVVK
ncbi:OmpH family outer membrane protein [Candidatus Schneideria nysicola]|uniref:OmpH family outer membrane protein n=1 Tax=Candidatus Schneideria nysicola TaxID=1081631 RepID=UPI001CAA75F3|nr:OmpH family outer membrane protein [Candidatus Schneideria nysicola]UAJ64976.1 OmpH family outer membrane protein [Candidatus Schneideria nysicola]UAJ65509.1 OmpH family outer membrane protein [Candidatus Schneideria nysicola]UAJ66038.1 OmpH family outer membrane protein [Candidatus Schneideria nysicola]